MTVEVEGLTRRHGATAALDGVSLALRKGEFAALLGPSGSGKTTLLRIIAGLDFADAGAVRIDGRDMAAVPARERRIGVVFQHYALFRHMTVFENVAFGLRVRPRAERLARSGIADRVRRLLALVQIPELADRHPDQVSGGQRQRVALARALAIEPSLLLLDEPFGALDAMVRKDLRRWLRGLHDQLGITSILVTHDQEEAMELADRVAVMERGRIAQFDAPGTLMDRPATPFVAGFIGEATRIECRIESGWLRFDPIRAAPLPVTLPDGACSAFLKPWDVIAAPMDAAGAARVRLVGCEAGGTQRLVVEAAGTLLEAVLAPGAPVPAPGQHCALTIRSAQLFANGRAARIEADPRQRAPVR